MHLVLCLPGLRIHAHAHVHIIFMHDNAFRYGSNGSATGERIDELTPLQFTEALVRLASWRYNRFVAPETFFMIFYQTV
jgi:hypothetical protein